jgi:hypothetical protein
MKAALLAGRLHPWWVDDDCVKKSTISMETIEIAGRRAQGLGSPYTHVRGVGNAQLSEMS